jgi:hypothetical protein
VQRSDLEGQGIMLVLRDSSKFDRESPLLGLISDYCTSSHLYSMA